ncbi:MAG: epoxyqueuosine reductase [Acidimicrobiia bacterium]
MTSSTVYDQMHRAGMQAGLCTVAVCDAAPFVDVAGVLRRRRAAGLSGRLRFTFGHPERSTSVRRSAPWARCLVVAAVAYAPPGRAVTTENGKGRVAAFATVDSYRPLRRGLRAMAAVLASAGYRTLLLADDNRLVDRAAAVRAGIGWWGKSTMVLAPGVGPWLLLGSVATDAPLTPAEPMRRDCGTCDSCIPACPTGAILSAGVLDASRCISHWLQAPGVIPLPYRLAIGGRFYGCDECLRACPPGHRMRPASHSAEEPDMEWVLCVPGGELLERFAHFYVPRRDPAHLRRNALIVLGNTGSRRHLRVVSSYLDDASSMLRAHAVWAVARLGATALLERHAGSESNPLVTLEYAHVSAGRVAARSGGGT